MQIVFPRPDCFHLLQRVCVSIYSVRLPLSRLPVRRPRQLLSSAAVTSCPLVGLLSSECILSFHLNQRRRRHKPAATSTSAGKKKKKRKAFATDASPPPANDDTRLFGCFSLLFSQVRNIYGFHGNIQKEKKLLCAFSGLWLSRHLFFPLCHRQKCALKKKT